MNLPAAEDITKSSDQWRDGIFALLGTLYAVVDFSLMERDQHVQRWLYHTGNEWVGDPDEPSHYMGIPFHRLYVQERMWVLKTLAALKENEKRLASFLAYKDRLIRGTQDLFVNKPSVLYLLCMHVEMRLKESAKVQSVNLNDPPEENSVFVLYNDSTQARQLLRAVHPPLKRPHGEWLKEYSRKL